MTIKEGKEYRYTGEVVAKYKNKEEVLKQAIIAALSSHSNFVTAPADISIKDVTSFERDIRYVVEFRTTNNCDANDEQIKYAIDRTIMGCHEDIIGVGTGSYVTR